jgi:pyridoxal 5-phosphate dependent beta-lyase
VTDVTDQADSGWNWWRERRLPAQRVHLDSAAAGRSSRATLAATAAHAEREAELGAYVAAAQAAPVLAEGRATLAGLLGVPAAGLAFVPSAEAALTALLAAWPLAEGDTVAVAACEWGPNLHAFGARACASPRSRPTTTAPSTWTRWNVCSRRRRLPWCT